MALKTESILVGTKTELLEYFNSLPRRTLECNEGEVSDDPISFETQLNKMEKLEGSINVGLVFYMIVMSKTIENKFPKIDIGFVSQYIRIIDETKH